MNVDPETIADEIFQIERALERTKKDVSRRAESAVSEASAARDAEEIFGQLASYEEAIAKMDFGAGSAAQAPSAPSPPPPQEAPPQSGPALAPPRLVSEPPAPAIQVQELTVPPLPPSPASRPAQPPQERAELGSEPLRHLEAQAYLGLPWKKIAECLESPLSNAHKQLRESLHKLSVPQRRPLIPLLNTLSGTIDNLKLLKLYLEPPPPLVAAQALAPVLASLLSAWDRPLKLRRVSLVMARLEPGTRFAFDPQLFKRAAHQIVKNAYEAMPDGGFLKVGLARSRAGASVVFSDCGPGFPKETLAEPFVPFKYAKPDHIGLGLCVALKLMRQSGGSVKIANNPQRGAFVEVSFAGAGTTP